MVSQKAAETAEGPTLSQAHQPGGGESPPDLLSAPSIDSQLQVAVSAVEASSTISCSSFSSSHGLKFSGLNSTGANFYTAWQRKTQDGTESESCSYRRG